MQKSETARGAGGRFAALQTQLLEAQGVHAAHHQLDGRSGKAVHVIEAGTGRPLLFLHGGGDLAVTWAALLAALQDRFRCLAVDRPGFGQSHPVDYRRVPDLRMHADAFVSRVLDLLGLERATLVGNSMGGFFALAFALAHPERVEALVLIGAPVGTHRSLPLQLRLLSTPGLGPLLWRTVARPTEAHLRRFFEALLVSDPAQADDELVACTAAGLQLPGAGVALLSLLRRFATLAGMRPSHDLTAALPALEVPTLFVWGDDDPFAAPGTPDVLASRMPSARVIHVPGASHFVWLADPEGCASSIADFLWTRPAKPAEAPAPLS